MTTYNVYANLNINVAISISAKSLEEALEKSKGFKEKDFIQFEGEYIDGNMKINGIIEEGV
jgi:hypothetical protein